MKDLECIPSLTIAEKQITELETAISVGNYSALQGILLRQALTLHNVGIDFMQLAGQNAKMNLKAGYMDIALRSFAQSQKTMATIQVMKE